LFKYREKECEERIKENIKRDKDKYEEREIETTRERRKTIIKKERGLRKE
jgi:hypothetical protein